MFVEIKKLKKIEKTFKKGVDKPFKGCYYVQARSRAPNLENDTESKKRKRQSINLSLAPKGV